MGYELIHRPKLDSEAPHLLSSSDESIVRIIRFGVHSPQMEFSRGDLID